MGYIITFFFSRYLRFTLKGDHSVDSWYKFFNYIMVASPVLFIISKAFASNNLPGLVPIPEWIIHFILLFLLYVTMRSPKFKDIRLLSVSLIPVILISFLADVLKLISPSLSNEYDTLISFIEVFSFVWLVGTFILFRRQMKAIEREKQLRELEAAENRRTAKRKEELESMVVERTAEITAQKETLEKALVELNAAQEQLIQSEKMASLGELTAGIAHEIQNPLNFINNFAELNAELTEELLEALKEQDYDEAKALAENIMENETKVVHHGKRADGIVKSMLQHSRKGNGQKEKVDVNIMVDECIRLSYHGMRAKEKNFNAKMEFDLDKEAGVIDAMAGELSRVILNICTNAFYAVLQRSKLGHEGYYPTIWLQTKNEGESVQINIRDNGMGIPKEILDKVFQPFFTTKPTGEGTGLGLSMSYDIITKGHNGQLIVESEDGQGATFKIILPKIAINQIQK